MVAVEGKLAQRYEDYLPSTDGFQEADLPLVKFRPVWILDLSRYDLAAAPT
jgi:hypothetical protein